MSMSEQHCRREEILDAISRSGLLVEISEYCSDAAKPPSGAGGSFPAGSKPLIALALLASAIIIEVPSYMISTNISNC